MTFPESLAYALLTSPQRLGGSSSIQNNELVACTNDVIGAGSPELAAGDDSDDLRLCGQLKITDGAARNI